MHKYTNTYIYIHTLALLQYINTYIQLFIDKCTLTAWPVNGVIFACRAHGLRFVVNIRKIKGKRFHEMHCYSLYMQPRRSRRPLCYLQRVCIAEKAYQLKAKVIIFTYIYYITDWFYS